MTQIEEAREGKITFEVGACARDEELLAAQVCQGVAKGEIVILKNRGRDLSKICGVGKGLKVKVNANIGTSADSSDISTELKKAKIAQKVGADCLMDLSTGGDIDKIRRTIISETNLPLGTVPIYQAAIEAGDINRMKIEAILKVIQKQAEDGVDFMTIHAGLTTEGLTRLKNQGRKMDIVSRGGAMLACWMKRNNKENPFYEHFDEVLDIVKEYDVTLSLGDGLRPGAIEDATDRAQIQELIILGELAQRAQDKGVQVMIEGPGHVPIHQIKTNVLLEKSLCRNAPFYVLGPLVTDSAPGYDHITAAIGGAIAGASGADFLCYVTPAEHLRLPSVEDVREGVIVTKIAAHAADIAKGISSAKELDSKMSQARRNLDWEAQINLSLDPEKARKYRSQSQPSDEEVCTMCGPYCAVKLSREAVT